MHGRIQWRLAAVLAMILLGAANLAWGQQAGPVAPAGPAYGPPAPNMPGPQYAGPVSPGNVYPVAAGAGGDPEVAKMAARLADVERQLRNIKDKADADKKKATLAPSCKPIGRIQLDQDFFSQDEVNKAQFGDARNGTEFRRARIGLLGEAFYIFDYRIEMDFASTTSVLTGATLDDDTLTTTSSTIGQVAFKDVYIGLNQLPWIGHIRAGHFKEPYGLEQLASSSVTTFMERSLGDEGAFVPGRNLGVMAYDWTADERATWKMGVFRPHTPDVVPLDLSDDGMALDTRLTWLPWYDEATQGRGLIHVGGAYSYRDPSYQPVRFRSREECHLAPVVVDASVSNVNQWHLLGAEAAMVYGPFSVQSEYFQSFVDRTGDRSGLAFNGYYVYCSYFLTGENRTYNRKMGCFDRVRPYTNFFRVRDCNGYVRNGCGAWEVGYRWSYIDLNDRDIQGGLAGDHTFGLNWYLNPYTRLMLNYVHSDDRPGSNAKKLPGQWSNMDIVEMRAQIDF